MMKIDHIWEELERDKSFSKGLLLRRYSGSVLPDVFIALTVPESLRCIAASISSSIHVSLIPYANLRDISIELIPDEKHSGKSMLLIKLLNDQHKDIFSVLCEDLIANISAVINEDQLVKELLSRFEQWKSLFDKAASNGLIPEEQRGLFGELNFIRKYLGSIPDYQYVISSWVGPEKQIRDFQSGTWSLEVKTSFGNNHQRIHISNERQLDISNLDNLFLYHLSIEARQKSGETLNQLVDSIIDMLGADFIALTRFKSKLLEGGYFDRHRYLYEDTGYYIRQETFYKVENEFPRLEEKDIPSGVGDVKYSLILSHCSGFIATEQQVLQTITPHE